MKIEDIKENDYCRIKGGIIAKAILIVDDMVYFDNDVYKHYGDTWGHLFEDMLDEYIIKSSSNLIDLIEVGDYVNGFKVDKDEMGLKIEMFNDNYEYLYNIEIETIITKEQMKEMEYRVNG